MKHLLAVMAALGAGAAAMYYYDPEYGSRRRERLADRLLGRPQKTASTAWHWETIEGGRSDAQLRGAIRTRLGRLVSHPRAIHVEVTGGAVRLSGDVLAKELDGLLMQVRDMPGVARVVNAMTVHEAPQGIRQALRREELEAVAA